MADQSQREFFDKLNAFKRNYLGKNSLMQFVGLQLHYTGSPDTLVSRRLFTKLYIKFCQAQDTFPADICQVGIHLSFAGIKSTILKFRKRSLNFYCGFLVFGMPWDKPFCSPKHRYVYVSCLPYIEIMVKQREGETSQCTKVKRQGHIISKKTRRKGYIKMPAGNPYLKRRK